MAKRWKVGEEHEYANGFMMKVVYTANDSGLSIIQSLYDMGETEDGKTDYAVACQETNCDDDEDVWCFVDEENPWQWIGDALALLDCEMRKYREY
jgi:hypothetical protein